MRQVITDPQVIHNKLLVTYELPAAPLALRLSANLLVGVVRIYARKARAGVHRGSTAGERRATEAARRSPTS